MAKQVDLVSVCGGNLASVQHCFRRLGIDYVPVDEGGEPSGNRPLVLPGVGAFGAVMQRIVDAKLEKRIVDIVKSGTPFLGICVGMQILFDGSEESPGVSGLGLLKGKVVKFRQGKVPQIGWNRISARNPDDNGFVYFVNSFYAQPESETVISYTADYFGPFCAAVAQDNITAFQFHPEKSGAFGQRLLERWLEAVN